jgi:hypothetical protein
MRNIIVPESALETSDKFKQWFSMMYAELFGDPLVMKLQRTGFPKDPERATALLEMMLKHVNLILFGDPNLPYFKTKTKRFSGRISDVLAVTAHLILEQYAIQLVELGNHLSVNHATVIYYRKKVNDRLCVDKKFASAYIRILLSMQRAGLIDTIKIAHPELSKLLKVHGGVLAELK